MKKWNVPVVPKADNNGVVDNNLKQMVETHRNRKVTATSDHFQQYTEALSRMNLSIVSVDGDGNCLFRAVSHQVYGSDSYHGMVRSSCMDYMEANADFFSQFVVGGMDSFHLYVAAKRMNAVWGDDPEIHAMCEIYDLPAEIWAHDSRYGARKLLTFHEGSRERVRGARSAHPNTPMRLSYYGGGHYDSIVDNSYNNSFESYRGILNGVAPGVVERTSIERARKRLKASSAASVSESSSAFSTNAPLTNDRDAKFDNSGLQEEQAQLQRALTESRKNLIHNLCYEQDVQANTSNGTDDFVSGDVEQSMLWNIIQQEKVVEAKECANAKGSFSAETGAKSDDCKGSVNEIQNFTAVTDAKELKEIEIKETNDVLLQSAVLESENEEVNRAIQASLKDTGKNPILCYNEDEDLRMATQLSYNSKEFEDNQLRRAIEASVMDSKTEIAPFVAPSNDYALDDMLHFDDDPDLELERAIAESLNYSKK